MYVCSFLVFIYHGDSRGRWRTVSLRCLLPVVHGAWVRVPVEVDGGDGVLPALPAGEHPVHAQARPVNTARVTAREFCAGVNETRGAPVHAHAGHAAHRQLRTCNQSGNCDNGSFVDTRDANICHRVAWLISRHAMAVKHIVQWNRSEVTSSLTGNTGQLIQCKHLTLAPADRTSVSAWL